jgi:hypothetical protein
MAARIGMFVRGIGVAMRKSAELNQRLVRSTFD